MKYRVLGKTGLKVSEVGMGTWQLAGDPGSWAWGSSDIQESYRSLFRFAELGGNFIDTAWVYGYDDAKPDRHPSENLIGKFLKESGRRQEMILATKVPPKNMRWPADSSTPVSEVFPPDWIESCVNDSLASLGVDTIDIVQFHVWDDSFADDDGWKTVVQNTIQSGKVRYWGISINNYQPANCIKTLDTGLISTVQFIFNIFHQQPTRDLFPYAQKHNIGLIARVPLDEGGLSGRLTVDTEFESGDFRNHYFQPSRLVELVKHTDRLQKLLGTEAGTLPELALRYILSWDEVSTVIPGLRKVSHVEANTAVSDGRKLSEKLMSQLKSQAWERDFYS